ncbi:MAG: sugar lyase [Bacteroidales bacterium]|nr:sugar lyase [Bacteroidales bacterium]
MKIKYFVSTIILAASVLLSGRMEAQVVDYGLANGVLSFEDGTAPAQCSKGSALSVSQEHSKLGTSSLKWDWRKNDQYISIKGEIPYLPENPDPKETSIASFVFWMYSPVSLDGTVRFSFLKDGRECCWFDYYLGFQGWRGSWVGFDRDMQGEPEIGMDEVRIYAPENIRRGTLYFDGLITSSFQDVRYHTPDFHAPYVNEKTDIHWLVLNNSWKLALDIPQKSSLTDTELQDMKTVKERFVQLITEKVKEYSFEEAVEMYDSYQLSFNSDGTINGKPIYFIRYGETYLNQGIPDAKQAFTKAGQLLKDLNDKMLRLAVTIMNCKDAEQKEELSRMYVNLTRHLLDQGFAAGSGQGTLHHLGYSMRNFYTGPVIMQDVLKEAGLDVAVQQAMEWFSGVGEIKIAPAVLGMDIDAFNTSLMGRVASLLMLEDTPYKYAYMQALARWVDNGMKHTEGLRPCFKTDGTVVHHRKAYPAYATGGFTGAVNAVWMLAKTSFAVSQESHQNLKDALLAMRFYCYDDIFPLAMSGRHPDGKGALIPSHYSRLAMAGSPDGKTEIDEELAAAFRRLAPKSKAFASIAPESTPQGTEYYGFSCSMSHRYGEDLVTIAGHSRYLWAAEIYQQANHYGRYLTHGSMDIGGFSMLGWDWCHIPGTTAAVLPMEQMKANVLNVDEFSGYEEMLISDEWFAGGVTHEGRNGAFAMKLHEHDKYNGTLRARKSFFAFENRIVCLGTDIENGLADAPVHTTLFQKSLKTSDRDTCCVYEDGVITDHDGVTYIVKDADIHFRSGVQHSLHEESDKPVEGLFEVAYIDHGDIVKDGRYEYVVILPDGSSGQEPAYEIVRHDSRVHSVRDIPTGIVSAAVFEEDAVDQNIISCTPAMLMYSMKDDAMTLSVANPDLALYEGESDEKFDADGKRLERSVYSRFWIDNACAATTVKVTVEGLWEVSDYKGSEVTSAHEDGHTVLTFISKEARTEEITLKRVK